MDWRRLGNGLENCGLWSGLSLPDGECKFPYLYKGIPTVVWFCPILPFINDTEENLRGILDYCIRAKVYGIINFGIGLTLREGNREYFYQKLEQHFPGLKEKYIRSYGNNYTLNSPNHQHLMKIFYEVCKGNGIVCDNNQIFKYLHTFEEKKIPKQLSLFD